MAKSLGPNEKQLGAILDVARSAVAAFDPDGKLIHTNLAERALFVRQKDSVALGQTVEQYLTHNRWFNMQNEPIPITELPIVRAMRGEEVFEERLLVERKPGDMRYVLQNARPLMIDGEFSGAAMLSFDLTSLRESSETTYTGHMENAVRRSRMIADIVMEITDNSFELDLHLMTDFAMERIAREFKADSGVLWLLDSKDRLILHATHNTDRVALSPDGYPLEEFIFAHEALDRNQPMLVQIEDLQAPETVAACMGEAKSVLVIPLRIRNDRIGMAYLCISDNYLLTQSDRLFASVWGRQCAQGIEVAMLFEQVDAANDRLVGVVDQMPQAVVLIDARQEKVRIANTGASNLFGKPITENTPIYELAIQDADGVALRGNQHPFLRIIHGGDRITGEPLLIPQPDGTVREVISNHVPIFDSVGNVYAGVSVFQDRSDFASMDRVREEFISVVGHELRNPLTSLRGNLQLLQRRIQRREQDEHSEDDLHRIGTAITEADRIGDLITRVLDVSRAGLGHLDIQPQTMEACKLVREVAAAAQVRQPNRPVISTVPEGIDVVWDADRMYQVLGNLTQNADRYAPNTPLELTLQVLDDDQIQISVRDHGPGVPPKIRRRLFRQYYRFDDGSDDSMSRMADGSRGLGIGLYISSRIVRQHGGRLRVQDAVGGGAEFIITMPLVSKPRVDTSIDTVLPS